MRTAVLLIACGTLGMIAADAAAEPDPITFIAGGNGMALGALAAWFVIRRAEVRGEIGEDLDVVGVAVCAVVVILLPLFAPTADWVAGLGGRRRRRSGRLRRDGLPARGIARAG